MQKLGLIMKLELRDITSFLSGIELFKKINPQALEDLASSLTILSVEGGTAIIRQGEQDTSMYLLYQGRLRVYVKNENSSVDQEINLAEISVGQFVGEIALLTHAPRTTTVRAVRDSILLKWEEQAFKKFEQSHPAEVTEIAKIALKRLATKRRPDQMGENVVAIVIAPAGSSNHSPFSQRLAEKLNQIKPTVLVNKKICNQLMNLNQDEWNESDLIKITSWLLSIENKYPFVLYETDSTLTPWTQLCLRQADRLIFVADPAENPELNAIEKLYQPEKNKILPFIEIVLVHPEETTVIKNTNKWLENRFQNSYQHLKLNSSTLFDKYIRFLTGRAFGIVLNGGGARAMAHIGFLMAAEKFNIPIDFIAGTSMGAVVGGCYASLGLEKLVDFSESFSKNFRKNWTFPLMSMLTARYVVDKSLLYWGDQRIEDLWTRYFCVSTNVTQGKVEIHERGPIWIAARATTAVPGVYPPIYDEEGNMLVDGGVMNNMPVDIMRKKICGGKILAVNCNMNQKIMEKRKFPFKWVSGWNLIFQKLNPFYREKLSYDHIFNILLSSMNLSLSFQQNLMEKEADYLIEFNTYQYGLFDFQHWRALIELGYNNSMERLPLLFNKEKK